MTTERTKELDRRRKRRKERVKARIREAKSGKPAGGDRIRKPAPAAPAPKAPGRKAPAKAAAKTTPPATGGDSGAA